MGRIQDTAQAIAIRKADDNLLVKPLLFLVNHRILLTDIEVLMEVDGKEPDWLRLLLSNKCQSGEG